MPEVLEVALLAPISIILEAVASPKLLCFINMLEDSDDMHKVYRNSEIYDETQRPYNDQFPAVLCRLGTGDRMTVILGIDPGSRITGYGIIRQDGQKLNYLGSGCIRTKVDDLPGRLKLIYVGISKIITQFQPDCLAIEQVFMAKNSDSALKLGQARGAAIAAAINLDLPVFEYAARQVKQAVVGTGSAEKNQVQHMVRTLLTLSAKPQSDAADALATAITHCHISQNAMRIGDSRLNLARGRLN